MKFTLRPYQKEASDKAVEFLSDKAKNYNAIIVLPTGAGKSLVVADIAFRMNTNVLVLQPSKEILEQNYNKMKNYCDECSMYSASVGKKEISKITFATIGSIFRHPEDFKDFKVVISDECHLTEADGGMYKQLYEALKCKVLGLTATPYRLKSQMYIVDTETDKKRPNFKKVDRSTLKDNEEYLSESKLEFLTNIYKGNFKEVLYCVQVEDLVKQGFLAKVNYYKCPPPNFHKYQLFKNTTGAEYSDKSLEYVNKKVGMTDWTNQIIARLLKPKSGIPRKGIIVFTKFVEDAENIKAYFNGQAEVVSGKTPKKERARIIEEFKEGKIKIIANVGTLVVGFDYPELDTLVFARPTMSLSVWYQAVGRVLRPHKDKEAAWVVDLCNNYNLFGKVEDLKVVNSRKGWMVVNKERQLTGTIL